ncbi:MAG: DUF86 domain-containing protein [Chloroflexi bacterium]|nr:DUF86 domain-containing protein [Chloroflexota bacterium]
MPADDERLRDIHHATEAALRFVEGRTRADLDADELLTAGLMHEITVIGEAAQSLTSDRREAMTDIPWRQIIGMRNVIVHAYWRIDPDELWRTVSEDLPLLHRRLRESGRDQEV